MQMYGWSELLLSTQIKLFIHNKKRFKWPLMQEKLRFLVNSVPKTLDNLVDPLDFFSNFEEIINSYALYIFLEHIKAWEVSQLLKM